MTREGAERSNCFLFRQVTLSTDPRFPTATARWVQSRSGHVVLSLPTVDLLRDVAVGALTRGVSVPSSIHVSYLFLMSANVGPAGAVLFLPVNIYQTMRYLGIYYSAFSQSGLALSPL